MASSRRTYDTDVITLRTVFAKNPGNSNIPALRTLTADGQGGTFWAVPSSLGLNPSFNRIITSAGTYTADLSYNTFRLTSGENIGMTDGPPGSNETYVFAKAFSQFDISGENTIQAFKAGVLDSSVTLAGQNGITLRGDPATNTLFIVGPASNAYTLSTGIYGFNQIKVTEAASSITNQVVGWDGTFLTATSPSTLLRFIGYNDIQLSTNVTTNSIFFTISTFTSKGYLDISAAAFSAYPSTLSTVSSLYTQTSVFDSTVAYLSSITGFSFSSVTSSINALAISTGEQFYILTGLINARATIVQLNSEISNVNANMLSTTIGLGTLGYISSGTGGLVANSQLVSTVEGLGTAGYISSAAAGDITKANLLSTVQGLGSAGYISSLSTIITSSIFAEAISTYSLEVFGPATLTNSGSTILRGAVYIQGDLFTAGNVNGAPNTIVNASNLTSTVGGLVTTYATINSVTSTVRGLGTASYVSTSQLTSTVAGLGTTYVSSTQLASTVAGLGSARYISSAQLFSSLQGIGSLGYLSALRGFTVSSGNVITSSLILLDGFTSALNYLTVSSGSLLVNGAFVGGGSGGGSSGVAQILGGANIGVSPGSGTGVVTITNLGPTQNDVNTAISSFSTSLQLGSTFYTAFLQASTQTTANILPSQSNLWVAVGYGATTPNSIQYSGDGSNWSNSTSGGFSLAGKSVAYNGSLWVAVGNNGGATGSIQVSTDGRSWTNQTSGGFSSGANGVAYNGSVWIAVGNNGGSATTSIQISTDGRNWSGIASGGFSVVGEGIAWNGSYWVATGQGATAAASIQYSIDGLNWVSATTGGFSAGGKGIAWNGSLWVAVGDDVTRPASIQYSADGRNWFNSASGGFISAGFKVAWNGRLWVAVGDDNVSAKSIQYSVDGSNWSDLNTGGFSGDGYGIAWNGFYWVAVGGGASAVNSIQISRDGSNWTNSSSGGFASGGVGVGFSSNLTPGYRQQGLTILSQNIPLFLTSTNQIFVQPSSLLLDNTLLVDGQVKRVGINCNTPGVDLDVGGIGRFQTLSTMAFSLSSINGANYVRILPSTVAGLGLLYMSTQSANSSIAAAISSFSTAFGPGGVAPMNLASTVAGLGTAGYVSTVSLASTTQGLIEFTNRAGFLSTTSLASTTQGLIEFTNRAGFLSTTSLASTTAGLIQTINRAGFLSTTSLASTTQGLIEFTNRAGFLSTTSLASTTQGLIEFTNRAGFLSTTSLASTTQGLIEFTNRAGFLSTTSLASTTQGLIEFTNRAGFLSTTSLASTTAGVQLNLNSTVRGLGNLYISSLINVNTLSSLVLNVSSINGALPGTGSGSGNGSSLTVSTGALFASSMSQVNIAPSSSNLWVAVGGDSATSNTIKYSYDGVTWANSASGGFASLGGYVGTGVAWNGSLWVAVGEDSTQNNTIQYSINGINWTNSSGTGFTTKGNHVAWNGRIWVAVGEDSTQNNTIKYSGNGINWSNSSGTGFTSQGYAVAWNGRMWVAVGIDSTQNNTIKYSYNGIQWFNSSGTAFTVGGYGIAFNGVMWVAVGADSTQNNRIKYSYDGITWSNSAGEGFTGYGNGVAWNGRLFVAVGQDFTDTNTIKYSSDGINWSNSAGSGFGGSFSSQEGISVSWNGRQWVAVGYDANAQDNSIKYSFDGINWTNSSGTGFAAFYGMDVAYSSNLTPSYQQTYLQILPQGIPLFLTSTNQILATQSSLVINNALTVDGFSDRVGIRKGAPQYELDVVGTGQFQSLITSALNISSINKVNITPAYSNLWIAVGSDLTQNNRIKYSLDGISWNNSLGTAFTFYGNGVAWNGTMWVAVGSDSSQTNTILYSYNGINWSNSYGIGFSQEGVNVAWNGRIWVAVGYDSTADNTIQYSGDGINWSNVSGGFSASGRGIAWNGRMWVATGGDATQNNNLKYSYDGINWSNSSGTGFTSAGNNVAWGGRVWVAVGQDSTANNTIKYSRDGINWSNSSGSGFSVFGLGVAWNGQMWVAIGRDLTQAARIKYSYDGITWSNSVSGAFNLQYGSAIAWNGQFWVAVGQDTTVNNSIKYSFDGLNWLNSSGSGFTNNLGNGVAYSSNTTPSYSQALLDILPQNIPLFYRSTNQILTQTSSLMINNTLEVDGVWNRVGINTGFPQADLDVVGTGRFQILSSLTLNVSSINGALPGSGTAGFPSTVSTVYGRTFTTLALNASSMTQVNITRSTSNLWIAVGNDATDANTIKYSYDGLTWANSSGTGFATAGNGVAWNGRLWVAVGNDATVARTIQYSLNGLSWTAASSGGFSGGASPQGTGIAWNGRLWVAVGQGGTAANNIQYSTDGSNWTNSSSGGFSVAGLGVAWNGQMWVAVGNDSTANNRIKYSFDGINWLNSLGTSFDTTLGYAVAWNGLMWVAVGADSVQNIKYSYNGINWSNAAGSKAFVNGAYGVAWNGRLWVAVGDDTTQNNTIKYSYDGINWSNSSGTGFTSYGRGVAWNGSLWVATGLDSTQNNRIKYSLDGINWFNSSGTGFATNGVGVGYSSNVTPSYQQENLQILPQNIPLFLNSTNQIYGTLSSIVVNNTLYVDRFSERVGVNIGFPQYDLDVNGTTNSVFGLVSSFTANSITVGSGAGWITTGGMQAVAISSIQQNTALSYISSLYVGSTTSVRPAYTLWANGNGLISTLIVGAPNPAFSTSAFRLTLTHDSATKPFTTAWTAASDQRVKSDITEADYERCYNDMKAIHLRRFTWNDGFFAAGDGYDKRVLGFVAQEVSSIVPKAVRISEGFGFSNFHYLNVDQLHMSLYGAVKKTIADKEVMESTIKGQRIQIETLQGVTISILSTLEGLQGR